MHYNLIIDELRSLLSRIRLIHQCNLARNTGPFQFSPERLSSFLLLLFVPFEEFVDEAEVGLDYDV
jgi:hypothetical protein